MSWIGINDFFRPSLTPDKGFPTPLKRSMADPNCLVPTGSMIIETRNTGAKDGTVLLSYSDQGDWAFTLDISVLPSQSLSVALHQGKISRSATVAMPSVTTDSRLRITLSWDAPARTGRLSVEDLDNAVITQTELTELPPLRAKTLAELVNDKGRAFFDNAFTLFAVSNSVEPVGLMPGLASGTRVTTQHGPTLVENLRRGDLVRTAAGDLAPIRWLTMREVPCAGYFAPIRLRAPFFGLAQDLCVAQDHRIVVAGTEAEYLFGNDTVLVEARHLLSSASADLVQGPGLRRFFHILLDNHELLETNGAHSESLFVGRLASAPLLLASTPLADLPSTAVPHHKQLARPVLKNYETIALVSALTA